MKLDTLFYNGNFFISPFYKGKVNWLISDEEGRVFDFGFGRPPRHLSFLRKMDLEGKRVVAGWIDSHVHLVNLGLRKVEIDVRFCNSREELFFSLKKKIQKQKGKTDWLEAFGLNTEKWPKALDAQFLDKISSQIPIVVRRIDEHAMWVNSSVLEMTHLYSKYQKGFLVDRPLEMVLRMKPKPSSQSLQEALMKAQSAFVEQGITSVHDMASQSMHVRVLSDLMRNQKYYLRVYCALHGEEAEETFSNPQTSLYQSRLSIRAKKIFIDGSLGSHGAWLSQNYEDKPGWQGTGLYDEKKLIAIIRSAVQKRFQLVFHVLGDRASQWVLNILNMHFDPITIFERRFRFEHVEVFHSDSLSLMKRFGIIASVQPWHALSDSEWLEKRLGKERLPQISRIKDFISKGIPVCGGSDAPIEPHSPLWGIYAAVVRRPMFGAAKKSFHSRTHEWLLDQKISIREAILMYTQKAAYAEFSENIKGSLDRGKFCDFVVLSDDILNMHPKHFLQVKSLMTVIKGKIVYSQ